jgi:hypothetical protein
VTPDHRKRLVVSSSRHQAVSDHQRETAYAGADSEPDRPRLCQPTNSLVALPERRIAAAGTPRRRPLVAREHNEHNVDSASPVPEHFTNEPFFDSRDEATAERLEILNDRSTARSPARGNAGHQGRPTVKRALMLAR